MAKIKHSGLISDIRGSMDNMTFSIQKTGIATVRQKALAISNPSSVEQNKIRCQIAVEAAVWAGLSEAAKAQWESYALTEPGKGNKDGGIRNLIKGNGGIMSGYNAFIMVNQLLHSADLAHVTAAPLGAPSPGSPSNIGASYAASKITVTWTDPAGIVAGDKIRVWLVNRQGTIHRQLNSIVADAIQTKEIVTVQAAQGVSVAVADYPGDYFIQLDCISQLGVKGGNSNTIEVEVT